MRHMLIALAVLTCSSACNFERQNEQPAVSVIKPAELSTETASFTEPYVGPVINTGTLRPSELVLFAESLSGTPYKYGSSDPSVGFDCSGFITYVFRHFGVSVPRSSVDFSRVEREIEPAEARRGDLILFTGTDSTKRVVGHMGIVTSPSGSPISFIHATSGKAYSVTTTPLNKYYQGRFVKVLRIFRENDKL